MRSLFLKNICQDVRLWLLNSTCLSSLKCHHFPTTFHSAVCSVCITMLQGLAGKATFPWVVLFCENNFSSFSWFWEQWRTTRNESKQEKIMLWAAEAAHMRQWWVLREHPLWPGWPALSSQWGWQRDLRHPGVSSTPQILPCEGQQYLCTAWCSFLFLYSKERAQFCSKIYTFCGFIMCLKDVVQTRRQPGELLSCTSLNAVLLFLRG